MELSLRNRRLAFLPLELLASDIDYLDLSYNRLRSLWGVEICANLRKLKCLANFTLVSTSSLNHLTQLEELDLSHNNLYSFDYTQCVKLQVLILTANHLRDISDIKHFSLLTRLDLAGNNITSLAGIQDCSQLEYLDINNNPISSLIELKSCVKLESLHCAGMKLQSLDGLQHCIHLKALDCTSNSITSLLPLQSCTSLTDLWCNYNQLTTLSGLQQCRQLAICCVNYNKLESLTGLYKIPDVFLMDETKEELVSARDNYNYQRGIEIVRDIFIDHKIRKIQRRWSYYWYEELVETEDGVKVSRFYRYSLA